MVDKPKNLNTPENDFEFKRKFDELVNNKEPLIVVKFFAQWCYHCELINEPFKEIVSAHANVQFINVDIDVCQNTSELHKITCVPSFVFFVEGTKVLGYCGSSAELFEEHLTSFLTKKKNLPIGAPTTSQPSNPPSTLSPKRLTQNQLGARVTDDLIAVEKCRVLNMAPKYELSNVIKMGMKGYIESHVGSQMLITVMFVNKINLGSFSVSAPEDCGPKLITLYYNSKSNPNFKDILNYRHDECFEYVFKNTHTFNFNIIELAKKILTAEDLRRKARIYFTDCRSDNVQKIIIYVQNNQKNTNKTRIDALSFFMYKPDKARRRI
ncbi:hypothetical protein HELRODRAFT_166232 [Helobdella robusta]|uniref:PITH domain-containing protein n=1 Tax=Helobdella robusta TaxID=6412 RepID=T1EXX4_HELRO|nr:hypothetical protein HELRODRAFT_166232 [Helobdella robusta]ESN90552.1 hypothetical protein HELRODRAFT_166232 [Helobdella robusta]